MVQHTSNSWPIDSNDPEINSLKMFDLVSSSGKLGIFRLHVFDDFMVALFGRSTFMLVSVSFMFVTGIALWMYWSTVSSFKKVLVADISATNGLLFYCSTFVRLVYYDSTSE